MELARFKTLLNYILRDFRQKYIRQKRKNYSRFAYRPFIY